jgi:hypothetical protein
MTKAAGLMSLLGILGITGCRGDSDGGPRTETPGDGGGADGAPVDARDGANAIVDAPVAPPITDADVQFQSTCTAPTGVHVPFTQPPLRCDGYPPPFNEFVVVNSVEQLHDVVRRYPCLTALPVLPISFETSRLVLVPVEGDVIWTGSVDGVVLLGIAPYGGRAPATRPFPIGAILPRSDTAVRALVCAPPISCNPCPP